MKTRKRSSKKTGRSRRRMRRTHKGGDFTKRPCYKLPRTEYVELKKQVKSPYNSAFSPYQSGGCDMFIWFGKDQVKHIHIHGFSNGKYEYTISALNKRRLTASLVAKTDEGYKDVLDQMYSELKPSHAPKSKLYYSPSRLLTVEEPDTPEKVPAPVGPPKLLDRIKLGPIMGEVADKKMPNIFNESPLDKSPLDKSPRGVSTSVFE